MEVNKILGNFAGRSFVVFMKKQRWLLAIIWLDYDDKKSDFSLSFIISIEATAMTTSSIE